MQLAEYKAEAIKTIKYRGLLGADLEHMMIGVFSEFNEFIDAIAVNDEINILEELGDFSWYITNYGTLRKVELAQTRTTETFTIMDLIYHASKLANLLKREVIYNKEINKADELIHLQTTFNVLCNFQRPDGKGVFDINDAWRRNINKLQKGKNARYKDAVYSDEAAQNRDEAAERKELEK